MYKCATGQFSHAGSFVRGDVWCWQAEAEGLLGASSPESGALPEHMISISEIQVTIFWIAGTGTSLPKRLRGALEQGGNQQHYVAGPGSAASLSGTRSSGGCGMRLSPDAGSQEFQCAWASRAAREVRISTEGLHPRYWSTTTSIGDKPMIQPGRDRCRAVRLHGLKSRNYGLRATPAGGHNAGSGSRAKPLRQFHPLDGRRHHAGGPLQRRPPRPRVAPPRKVRSALSSRPGPT